MQEDKSLVGIDRQVKGSFPSSKRNLFFVDLDTNERLGLLGVPKQLTYDPQVSWAVIKPFGKNTPNYHFTGAEDTLVLELTWWAEEEGMTDVVKRCKWVESMSKADGDRGRPHILRLIWGDLYRKAMWLVKSCPYDLFDFNAERGMMPMHAKQIVTLMRYNPENAGSELINDYMY